MGSAVVDKLISLINYLGGATPTILIGILITSMFLLFAKDKIKFPQKHIWTIWVCLIFSASMLTAIGLVKSYECVVNKIQEKERMESLTQNEIEALSAFIDKKTFTWCFDNSDLNTLIVLERDKIVSKLRNDSIFTCYRIEKRVYFYLLERPELLTENPT